MLEVVLAFLFFYRVGECDAAPVACDTGQRDQSFAYIVWHLLQVRVHSMKTIH